MNYNKSYTIFPKAIQTYLDKNLKNSNFGNLDNNLNVILKDLNQDDKLVATWSVNEIFFLDKLNVSREHNSCKDFDSFAKFIFKISAKENVTIQDFNESISTFEEAFIKEYQESLASKQYKIEHETITKSNKKLNTIYLCAFLLSLLLLSISVYLKIRN